MKISTRLILSFTLIVSIGFYFLTDWIVQELRPHYVESAEETLVDEAYLLAVILEPYFQELNNLKQHLSHVFDTVAKRNFQAQIYKLTKTHFDQRIYVTDERGIVIFDSKGLDESVDYSSWNNINRTLQGQYGARTSHEAQFSLQSSALHVSAPIVIDEKIVGTVTVAKPTTNINAFIQSAQPQFRIAGLLAAITVLVLGVAVSTWTTLPLNRLRRYAQDVRDGKEAQLPKLGPAELKELGYAFEQMRKTLEGKNYLEQHIQTLTHELKSPLAAILAAAELLQENLPTNDRKKFIDGIGDEAQRMQELIQRLLKLATIENQIELANPEPVDLVSLCAEVLDSFKLLFSKQSLVVTTHYEKSVIVLGDRTLLRIVFTNILLNAFEFTVEGAITVRINKNGPNANVIIENDGPSIPDYALPRLFEKFYSLPRPTTGKKSTGLGLIFVKEILKLHNGDITVSNRGFHGVIVKILLPL